MQSKDKAYSIKNFFGTFATLCFCLFMGVHCQPSAVDSGSKVVPQVTPAFYHWQTKLALSTAEIQHLDSLQANKLYIKFFDIDKKNKGSAPIPLALLQVDTNSYLPDTIIPTVFITNRSFIGLEDTAVDLLADRLFSLILKLARPLGAVHIPEIQIDCDWSAQTKDQYFSLLRRLRERHLAPDQQLSATIRLHQLKYPDQTGLPPIDRGMLMFYNMGEVTQWEESNSILNLPTAAQYIPPSKPYPIPLDIALPLFRWGVLFRDGKMIKLINELGPERLQDTNRFLWTDPTHLEVIQSTYLDGYYLYKGDRFRLESSQLPDLREAVLLLRHNIPLKSFTLAYYHLDAPIVQRFSHQALSNLVEQFKQTE